MAHIVIIVGQPRANTYCEALGESYARGAKTAGHEATLFVISKLTFDPILHEGFERVQPLEPDLQAAHDAMFMADHLVLIFPLWFGSLPALFKGFWERVLQPDWMAQSKPGKHPQLLKGKSARIILTMGMPALVYRWWFGAHALKMLKHNMLSFMGVGPIRSTIYGSIEAIGLKGRQRRLKAVEILGSRGQ
jgi:NAD(P)H dehydrogenase (quinone)